MLKSLDNSFAHAALQEDHEVTSSHFRPSIDYCVSFKLLIIAKDEVILSSNFFAVGWPKN